MYFSTYIMYRVRTTISEDQFFEFFDTLEVNYILAYAPCGVHDLSQVRLLTR